jgi:hypothetical protein
MQIPIVFIDPASRPTRLRCEGRHAARAVDRPLHRLEDARHVAARAVLRLDEGPAPLAHPLPLGRIREHGLDGSGELVAVADAEIRPVWPCRTNSVLAPVSVPITGRPIAIASMNTQSGPMSAKVGTTATSHVAYRSVSRSSFGWKSAWTWTWGGSAVGAWRVTRCSSATSWKAILEHIEQKLTALADEVAADEQDPEPTGRPILAPASAASRSRGRCRRGSDEPGPPGRCNAGRGHWKTQRENGMNSSVCRTRQWSIASRSF